MAIYQYRCWKCDHEFEVTQSMNDEPIKDCPICQEETTSRVVTGGNGFRIHGPGVYKPTSKIE